MTKEEEEKLVQAFIDADTEIYNNRISTGPAEVLMSKNESESDEDFFYRFIDLLNGRVC